MAIGTLYLPDFIEATRERYGSEKYSRNHASGSIATILNPENRIGLDESVIGAELLFKAGNCPEQELKITDMRQKSETPVIISQTIATNKLYLALITRCFNKDLWSKSPLRTKNHKAKIFSQNQTHEFNITVENGKAEIDLAGLNIQPDYRLKVM